MSEAAQFNLYSRCYETCGARQLGFSPSDFAAMLEEVIRRAFPDGCGETERQQFLSRLRMDDLVLARACARRFEPAWDRFLVLYREKLYSAAVAIAHEESTARELADSLYADLFGVKANRDGRRVSKLESYIGLGSLEGWLKTVLVQDYVNRYRTQRRLVSFDEEIEQEAQEVSAGSIFTSEQAELARATDTVLSALSEEEQFLLAAYHLDGRTLAEIGRILNVHESTVSRRLEKTTSGLRKRIVKELRRNGVSKRGAEEMLEMDVRDLGLDVRSRLVARKAE